MRDYIDFYAAREEDKKNKYFAPLMETDYRNQPDTLILTAEFDPLRDEGEEYGKRLKEAGNYVEVHRIKDALHGYFALGIRYFHVQESFELINQFLGRRGIKVFQQRRAYWRNLDNAAKMFSAPAATKDTKGISLLLRIKRKRLTEVFLRWHWIRQSRSIRSFCQSCEKDFSGIISRKVICGRS